MHPSFVDIAHELDDIGNEVGHLAERLVRTQFHAGPLDRQARWETTVICAAATEKIYTGCERVMARLITDLDGLSLSRADGWHVALLRLVATANPGSRGAIISMECYTALDKLRAFRHRVRNTYGTLLDFDIVVERADDAVAGFALFRGEIVSFLMRRGEI